MRKDLAIQAVRNAMNKMKRQGIDEDQDLLEVIKQGEIEEAKIVDMID